MFAWLRIVSMKRAWKIVAEHDESCQRRHGHTCIYITYNVCIHIISTVTCPYIQIANERFWINLKFSHPICLQSSWMNAVAVNVTRCLEKNIYTYRKDAESLEQTGCLTYNGMGENIGQVSLRWWERKCGFFVLFKKGNSSWWWRTGLLKQCTPPNVDGGPLKGKGPYIVSDTHCLHSIWWNRIRRLTLPVFYSIIMDRWLISVFTFRNEIV